MRKRVLWVAMTAVVLAVAILGVPLGFAVARIVGDEEHGELERAALRAAVDVSPDYVSGDPIELTRPESGVELGVYDTRGRRVAGTGPAGLEPGAAAALAGAVVGDQWGERLVAAVPVSAGEKVIAVVRAASPEAAVRNRTVEWWLVLAGACLVAALCACGFAARESRRLAVPLIDLARVAGDLGDGDFSVRALPSGVAEIDTAGDSLNRTASRLASMIERERSFAAQASHQLRTPLTQLQLELEAGIERGGRALSDAASSAMLTADQLSQTIDDVLLLARSDTSPGSFDAGTLLDQCRERWGGPLASAGRPLRVEVESALRVAASLPASRQILQVLLDNAFRHGRGAVTLRARESHGAVAIDVSDEGSAPTISMSGSGRLGLSLASTLASAQGGRLLVDQRGRGTRFTVLLPIHQT